MRTAAQLIAALFIAVACGGDDDALPVDMTQSGVADAGNVTVSVTTHPDLGEYIVDAEGLTLYVFALDDGTMTACVGACVDAWPPLVRSEPVAGDGIDQAALTTAVGIEPDQVVYHGQLLYYYVADQEPGSILGTQVPEWYAVRPDGSPIKLDEPAMGASGY